MKKIFRNIVVKTLQILAKYYLKKSQSQIILIFSHLNRQNIKEQLENALKEQGIKARSNLKGYNSDIGLPLSILNLQAGFSSFDKWLKLLFKALVIAFRPANINQVIVLEISATTEKEIIRLLSYLNPDIVIFGDFLAKISKKDLFNAYSLLINNLKGESLVIYNYDDLELKELCKNIKLNKIGFGKSSNNLKIIKIEQLENGQKIIFTYQNQDHTKIINKFGIEAVYSEVISFLISDIFRNKKL